MTFSQRLARVPPPKWAMYDFRVPPAERDRLLQCRTALCEFSGSAAKAGLA
jgi:hypothetical protein